MGRKNLQKGSGLVEILVAIFIFSIILGALINASSAYFSGAGANLLSTKAAYLAEEGIEAVKTIRDSNWSNISTSTLEDNTDYYLYFDTSSSTNNIWKATTTASIIDNNFVRTFKVNSVNRDANGRIISSGGTIDAYTKKLTVSISWVSNNSTTTKSLSTYITNIL